jgi:plastocyanin
MVVALLLVSCIFLGGKAYAIEILMGSEGMLVFEPCEVTVNVGDTVTFKNNELPPQYSHSELAFASGESFDVTFDKAGDYKFQCDPHAGAGMVGVIHVE